MTLLTDKEFEERTMRNQNYLTHSIFLKSPIGENMQNQRIAQNILNYIDFKVPRLKVTMQDVENAFYHFINDFSKTPYPGFDYGIWQNIELDQLNEYEEIKYILSKSVGSNVDEYTHPVVLEKHKDFDLKFTWILD